MTTTEMRMCDPWKSPRRRVSTAAAVATLMTLAASPAVAQQAGPGPSSPVASGPAADIPRTLNERGVPVLRATRGEPVVDGRLDDAAWDDADVAADFVQFEPDEGAPATLPTEARVVYGADALYVALRAWDSAPDSIVGQLSRRDSKEYSDWLGVMVDSYHDRRTAFHFMVNPRGVKVDLYRFDDTREDIGWDAVWEVETTVDERGWTAEFRIPYSQLRFREDAEQTWGINFMREIARYDETSAWAPTLQSESAIVSRFGELRGLTGIEAPRRLEVTPYTLARVRQAPGSSENPLYESTETFGAVGADMKYGITGDLTLDLTINPDFGQVEADPAQVNLSAFETFLPERRPFFVEGSNFYDFSLALGDGDEANEALFYTRRIGRTPQGRPSVPGGWVDSPENTTILGAGKVSGKTSSGWSIGTLVAVTSREEATLAHQDGTTEVATVEPLTTYAVGRVSRDFRDGRSAVGVIGTAVQRDRIAADALGIHRAAWTGGVDFRHRFGDGEYATSGYLLGSHVRGSEAAILRTQRSSARWFQRPDADHVELDPTRTSLSGLSASATVSKIAGGNWRWATGFQSRSPGFEVNDMGYMRETDFNVVFGYVGYVQPTPQGPFRSWRLNVNGFNAFSWGMERYNTGFNVNGFAQLSNFWHVYAGVNRQLGGLSNTLLRGGPAMLREAGYNGWGGVGTDPRQDVRLNLNANWSARPESDSWSVNLSPRVSWRPSGRADLSVGAFARRNVDDQQWIGRIGTDDDHRFVFCRIDQTTVGLTARVDYSFSPTLSLQLYAQPFVSAGAYDAFKQVTDPRADAYADRTAPVAASLGDDGRYRADLDGDGTDESWRNPDFNFRQFRSNAVLRWEYRPGSTIYAVWSQGRNHYAPDGSFDFGRGLDDLFGAPADDIFMIKVSYWLNP